MSMYKIFFIVGGETVNVIQMEGQCVFDYSYKRKTKIKTLASARAIKVTEDCTIQPCCFRGSWWYHRLEIYALMK